jgi:hypothetical protein
MRGLWNAKAKREWLSAATVGVGRRHGAWLWSVNKRFGSYAADIWDTCSPMVRRMLRWRERRDVKQ